MKPWLLSFDEWVMMLTIENEGIRWTRDLGLLGSLSLVLLDFGHDSLMSGRIARWSDLHQPTVGILVSRHWGLDEVATLKSALSKILVEVPRSHRKRVAIIATPSSPMMLTIPLGISISYCVPEAMF